jgi:thiol-disulfide isomerase/thioredoxin
MKKIFKKSNLIYLVIMGVLLFKVIQGSYDSLQKEGIELTSIELEDINGMKVLFPKNKKTAVIFWATWCGPCHIQMDLIDTLISDDNRKKEIIAISLGEDLNTVRRFLKKNPQPFTVLVDTQKIGWNHFGVAATPSMAILDQQNKISYFTTGISPLFFLRIN